MTDLDEVKRQDHKEIAHVVNECKNTILKLYEGTAEVGAFNSYLTSALMPLLTILWDEADPEERSAGIGASRFMAGPLLDDARKRQKRCAHCGYAVFSEDKKLADAHIEERAAWCANVLLGLFRDHLESDRYRGALSSAIKALLDLSREVNGDDPEQPTRYSAWTRIEEMQSQRAHCPSCDHLTSFISPPPEKEAEAVVPEKKDETTCVSWIYPKMEPGEMVDGIIWVEWEGEGRHHKSILRPRMTFGQFDELVQMLHYGKTKLSGVKSSPVETTSTPPEPPAAICTTI